MELCSIYKATNKINGKVYIGFTHKTLNERVAGHTRSALVKQKNTKFYAAIRKYGIKNFVFEIIYQSKDKKHCHNVMENYFIKEYDSIQNGYNQTEGGLGVLGIAKNKIWINDGFITKRIDKNEPIPNGWQKGRLFIKRKIGMSEESKKIIGQKNLKHLIGGKNPSAKKIYYKGKIYDTIKLAAKENNTSTYFILKEGTIIHS
jgi:group I intron endonuclease